MKHQVSTHRVAITLSHYLLVVWASAHISLEVVDGLKLMNARLFSLGAGGLLHLLNLNKFVLLPLA